VCVTVKGGGEGGSNEVERLASHFLCLQVLGSGFLITEITSILIRLWHPDIAKLPCAIYHGTYLENVMFTTHVRLMGYGTQNYAYRRVSLHSKTCHGFGNSADFISYLMT
jgi:hypothetical protein